MTAVSTIRDEPPPTPPRPGGESAGGRYASRELLARLCQRGWEFECLQAVWVLERYVGGDTPVGGRGPVAKERLRFRPDASLGFPATDLRRVLRCRQPDTGASSGC